MAGLACGLLLVAAACVGPANVTATADRQEVARQEVGRQEVGPQGVGPAADRSSRELLVAHDAMRNERIDTAHRGQVQLLFADQSSLSIAPGSEVVINEFLYDPQTQTGNLTATVTAGLVRYVGGEIGRKRDVAFFTPMATVSVRGGIVLIKTQRGLGVDPGGGGRTEADFLSGNRMCVTANGQSQCTTKFATAITSENGEPPSAPVPVTPETIQALLGSLQAADSGASTGAGPQPGGHAPPAADPDPTDRGLTKPR
jgi:hypothetical protein